MTLKFIPANIELDTSQKPAVLLGELIKGIHPVLIGYEEETKKPEVIVLALSKIVYGPNISQFVLNAKLEQLRVYINKFKSNNKISPMGCVLVEPQMAKVDWTLLQRYSDNFCFISPSKTDNGYAQIKDRFKEYKKTKLFLNSIYQELKIWQDQTREKDYTSSITHLAFRIEMFEQINKMLEGLLPNGKLSKYLSRKLKYFGHTSRDVFENFLRNVVIHHACVVASEEDIRDGFPTQEVVDEIPNRQVKELNVIGPGSLEKDQFLSTASHGLSSMIRWFYKNKILCKPDPIHAVAIYDILVEMVTRTMPLTIKERGGGKILVYPPKVVDINIDQRNIFIKQFSMPNDKENLDKCFKNFPRWLNKRLNDYKYNITSEKYGIKWFEKLVYQEESVDRKVLLGICFLDYIFPTLRRIPPYASKEEARTASKILAEIYNKMFNLLQLYLEEECIDKEELYLSIGDFIKAVFRYRGRWEYSGLLQRFINKHHRWFVLKYLKKRKLPPSKPAKDFEIPDRLQKTISTNSFFSNQLYNICIDKTPVIKGSYDGPFFVSNIFSGTKEDRMLEKLLATLLEKNYNQEFDRIIGIGRKGSIPGALLSLLLDIPFSTITPYPIIDVSPNVASNEKVLLVDDLTKTGFIQYFIKMFMQSHFYYTRKPFKISNTQVLVHLNKKDTFPTEETKLGVKIGEYFSEFSKCIEQSSPLLNCILEQYENEKGEKVLEVLPSITTSNIETFPKKEHIDSVYELFIKHHKENLLSEYEDEEVALRELRKMVIGATKAGIPFNMSSIDKEFQEEFNRSTLRRLINNTLGLAKKLGCSEITMKEIHFFLSHLSWEAGAKFKPSYIFNDTKLIWQIGAFFHKKLRTLNEERKPNVLLINNRLAIPLGIAICLHGRYDELFPINYYVLLVKGYAEEISSLRWLLRTNWIPNQKKLNVVSINNFTVRGNTEEDIWERLNQILIEMNYNNKDKVHKVATCSLFSIKKSHTKISKKPYIGEYYHLVDL